MPKVIKLNYPGLSGLKKYFFCAGYTFRLDIFSEFLEIPIGLDQTQVGILPF